MLSAAKHSESSAAFAEATKILTATIEKLNAVVEKVFDGNAVFVAVTVAEHRAIRTKRQAPGEEVEVSFKFIEHEMKLMMNCVLGQRKSLQSRRVDIEELPSCVQHHLLVFVCVHLRSYRNLTCIEQC